MTFFGVQLVPFTITEKNKIEMIRLTVQKSKQKHSIRGEFSALFIGLHLNDNKQQTVEKLDFAWLAKKYFRKKKRK